MAQVKLYGEIRPEMDEYDKVRERLMARLIEMNYPRPYALQTAGSMADLLVDAGYTDEKLQAASFFDIPEFVVNAFGEPDSDYTKTLREAYGKSFS